MKAKLTARQSRDLRAALVTLGASDVTIDDDAIGMGTLTRHAGRGVVRVGAFYESGGCWTVLLGEKRGGGFRASLIGDRRESPASVLQRLAATARGPFDREPRRGGPDVAALLAERMVGLETALAAKRAPRRGPIFVEQGRSRFVWTVLGAVERRRDLLLRYAAARRALRAAVGRAPTRSGSTRRLPWSAWNHAGKPFLLWASDHDPGGGLQVYLAHARVPWRGGPPW